MASDYERIRQDNIREYGEGTRHLEFLQRLYADRTHFILELLQNAEDARATQVTFVLESHRLIVHHDGRSFNEADVRGICGISSSTKEGELTTIGKFGIGFKAVYAYTATPEVHSADEHFRIKRFVRPEAADWFASPLNGRTVFVFPFDREDVPAPDARAEIGPGLRDLDPTTLLFLRYIRDVTIQLDGRTIELSRVRNEERFQEVELIRRDNGRVVAHQYWSVFDRSLDGVGYPGKRVEIAFKRTGAGPQALVERLPISRLVVFFPTDKQTGLGFLLQAPLRTTPARDNVSERDPQNIQLLAEATTLLLDALEQLRDAGRLGLDVFDVLPIDEQAFPEGSMLRPMFDAVRQALRNRPLLPIDAGKGYAPATQMRLARGGGVRDLLSAEQLGDLAGVAGPLYWPLSQMTRDRARRLWDYLRYNLEVEEITPEWIVDHLNETFLRNADDSWLIQFYAFLEQSPALWRPGRGSWERPGRARAIPLIRLEDGTQVTPFSSDGIPNAYLPGPNPTDYPTVRHTLTLDRGARSFLAALGLQEPDAVDEVYEKILPRYGPSAEPCDAQQHGRDHTAIVTALKVASGRRRADLVKRLGSTAFLLACNATRPVFTYHAPHECYWPDDELEHYFAPCDEAWFVDERYSRYRQELTELGVAGEVRVRARQADSLGRVVLHYAHGDHSRGLNGFDPDLQIAGLGAALASPDKRRSTFVWNRLLAPLADRLRGIVEFASRMDYTNAQQREQDTEPASLATGHAWLPTRDGTFAQPQEMALDDLPPDFVRHQGLAETLHMITSAVQQASSELGIPVDLLRYLSDNPDVLAEVEKLTLPARASADSPSKASVNPVAALDFSALVQDAFAKAARADGAAEDEITYSTGDVASPATRRERTAAAIREVQAAEIAPHKRFRFLPRKVWDGKDPAVRQFLLEQYAGRCQICESTFPKRDGSPHFEALYLVSHTNAAWIDRYGNVLCLCPTCTSKFLYGEVQAEDVLTQIRSWRSRVEGGNSPTLHIELCGEPKTICYTEKHFLDLQTMVSV